MSLGQDALENALSLVSSRDYTVTRNDSPASIAKKFGVSMDQLLNANPQKPTTVVRGVRTWTDLSINEGLNLPKAGVWVGYVAGVGDYAVDAVRAASAVDPCARENVRHVCAAQAAMGFRPDGKWGTDTYIAALGFDPQARPGCSPRPAWWPPPGYGACAPQMNEVLVEARKDLAQMEAWKRAREGNGTMSGIRLNGSPIAGLGLGQDPSAAPPPAAPPVGLTPEQAGAQAAGAAADASSKKVIAGHHHHLSMPVKVGIGVGAAAVAAGVVYACTRGKKKRSRRRSRR